jgi:hypothetical protein
MIGRPWPGVNRLCAYLGKDFEGELRFALTLAGKPRDELQKRIEKLLTTKPPVPQRTWRKPQWVKPELRVRVRHLAGGDSLIRKFMA